MGEAANWASRVTLGSGPREYLVTIDTGSRMQHFEKGWHMKTTLRDFFHLTFPGLLLNLDVKKRVEY